MSMPEWKIKELEHLEKMWAGKRRSGLSHSRTMWNGIADEWGKELAEDPVRQLRSRKRVEKTAEYLILCGALTSESEVLDIGCGPGRFVAEFAKTAKHASGLDLSDRMTGLGLEYCHEQGLNNVSFYSEDFKTLDPAEAGLAGRFDLVFTSITPAVGSREGFWKALDLSRRWFFNAAFIHIGDSLLEKLDAVLGTNSSDPKNSEGFYAMFNEMLLRNYYPRIEYYEEEDTEVYDPDTALGKYAAVIWSEGEDARKLSGLREALHSLKDADGRIRTKKQWVYGWMLVDKDKVSN